MSDAEKIYRDALEFLHVDCKGASVDEMRNLFAASMKIDRNKTSDADLLEIAKLVPTSLDHMNALPAFDSDIARRFPNASRTIRIL